MVFIPGAILGSAPVRGVADAGLPWKEMIWVCWGGVSEPVWAEGLAGAVPQQAGLKAGDGGANPQLWAPGEISDGHFQYLL